MKFSSNTLETLLKKAGAKRVSKSSKETLLASINKKIVELTKKSAEFSRHAGRKTIRKEDVDMAISLIS